MAIIRKHISLGKCLQLDGRRRHVSQGTLNIVKQTTTSLVVFSLYRYLKRCSILICSKFNKDNKIYRELFALNSIIVSRGREAAISGRQQSFIHSQFYAFCLDQCFFEATRAEAACSIGTHSGVLISYPATHLHDSSLVVCGGRHSSATSLTVSSSS
jgi:hypothetical protein